MKKPFKFLFLAILGLLLFSTVALAGSDYDESVDGDLSGDRLAPTILPMSEGSNKVTATSVAGDLEYFTVEIPPGFQLDALLSRTYVSADDRSFIAMQEGSSFTEPPSGTNVANLLGYTHFGTGLNQVGTDILDDLAAGPGAIGFSAPLPSGNYSFWAQEVGLDEATYTPDFIVVQAEKNELFLPYVVK